MEWVAFFAAVVVVISLFPRSAIAAVGFVRRSARKLLLLFVAFVAVSSLAIFILLLIAYVNTSQNYSDFTQFATAHEVQTFFEGRLKVGQATQADVQALIDTDHIRQCEFTSHTGDPKLSGEIYCAVRGPGSFPIQALFWSWYYIDFFFENGITIEIRVINLGPPML